VTPEQLAKAERLRGERNVEFRPARIEALPYADASFDVVISNGVVNLTPDKAAVFAEAARVLRPGGRLALSDIVTDRQIRARTAAQSELWAACIAGASQVDDYLDAITAAGLEIRDVRGNPQYEFASERARRTQQTYGAQSVSLLAEKPVGT
jgi:arsenite methyltransferase